jgi:hypothetical protein
MKLKKIQIKYKDYIDIIVPETFLFTFTLRITDEVLSDEKYRIKGKYIYDTVNTISASDILHHNFPKDASFIFKCDTNFEMRIPIENLECECIGEYNF